MNARRLNLEAACRQNVGQPFRRVGRVVGDDVQTGTEPPGKVDGTRQRVVVDGEAAVEVGEHDLR